MQDSNPSGVPRLTEKFVAARTKDNPTWHNPQADVTVMMQYMFEHVVASLRARQWPEAVELLAGTDPTAQEQFIEEDCKKVHMAVYDFIRAAYEPTEQQAEHAVFMETLDEVGWRELKVEAKVMYLYMLGLFHLSRCWVVGRQSHALGIPPAADVIDVMAAAGVEFRMYDQNVTPKYEAAKIVGDAVHYAAALDFSEQEVHTIVQTVYSSQDTGQGMPDLSSLGKLPVKKCCGGGCHGKKKNG